MANIILYSLPTCPQCKMVHRLLDDHKIQYTECQDTEAMRAKNILQVPVLAVEEELLAGKEIFTWVMGQK